MYLFTRAGRLAPGSIREATSFVEAITERVRQETGLDVHTWASTMSPDLGTMVWATFVDDLAHLEEANDKLGVSQSFSELAESGARLFAGPLTDRVAQIMHGERDASTPMPSYVAVVRATAVNGQLRAAISNGIEVAEAATRITGTPTMFLVDATGPYGGCRWTTGYSDVAELERAEATLLADDGWLELVDRVGPSYVQGAEQAIYRRLF